MRIIAFWEHIATLVRCGKAPVEQLRGAPLWFCLPATFDCYPLRFAADVNQYCADLKINFSARQQSGLGN